MSAGYYQKTKKCLKRRLMKGIKIFLKNSKTKNLTMLVNDIGIFLRKRKAKSKNVVSNYIKIFRKIKNKG